MPEGKWTKTRLRRTRKPPPKNLPRLIFNIPLSFISVYVETKLSLEALMADLLGASWVSWMLCALYKNTKSTHVKEW